MHRRVLAIRVQHLSLIYFPILSSTSFQAMCNYLELPDGRTFHFTLTSHMLLLG